MPAATENWLHLAKADPEFEKILATNPRLPDLEDIKEVRENVTPKRTPAPEGVTETEITIPNRDRHKLRTRVFSPSKPSTDGSPLYVAIHPGAFFAGAPEIEEANCRSTVLRLGCVCGAPSYRPAPGHPFPAGPNDTWDAIKWIASHAAELAADSSKGFVVGGQSVGTNFAAVCALLARDEKLNPPLTGLYLCNPLLLSHETVPEKYKSPYLSYEQNKDALILNKSLMKFMSDQYKPDPNSWLYNPFNHPDGHAGLPPVYLQVCGMDPVRDEALIYDKVLREEYGVKTKLDVYPGVPHVFWVFFKDMKVTAQFQEDIVLGVKWLLEQK